MHFFSKTQYSQISFLQNKFSLFFICRENLFFRLKRLYLFPELRFKTDTFYFLLRLISYLYSLSSVPFLLDLPFLFLYETNSLRKFTFFDATICGQQEINYNK